MIAEQNQKDGQTTSWSGEWMQFEHSPKPYAHKGQNYGKGIYRPDWLGNAYTRFDLYFNNVK